MQSRWQRAGAQVVRCHGTGSFLDQVNIRVNIMISSEAMCLGVLLDSALNFAPHARRLSGKSFLCPLPVKVKYAICNPAVMSVLLSVCNRNAWAKNL